MYYIDENRKRVNCELYKAFMWSEFETLKMTKYADDEILMSINILLELLEHWDMKWDTTAEDMNRIGKSSLM